MPRCITNTPPLVSSRNFVQRARRTFPCPPNPIYTPFRWYRMDKMKSYKARAGINYRRNTLRDSETAVLATTSNAVDMIYSVVWRTLMVAQTQNLYSMCRGRCTVVYVSARWHLHVHTCKYVHTFTWMYACMCICHHQNTSGP